MMAGPASTNGGSAGVPASHPLIAELSSLRAQLAQYQKVAHQASISLQGTRLELSLAHEEKARLAGLVDSLRTELAVLRKHPPPPRSAPQSDALTQLSLAHRRLSTKLDLTESTLAGAQLELAQTRQEVVRLKKERDGERATVVELRRRSEEWEDEMAWEKGARRKAEEEKKLADLALQEYAKLVHSLDPSAVPPETPSRSLSKILTSVPSLTVGKEEGLVTEDGTADLETATATPARSAEVISTLLVGQKGVQQLFEDFTSTLSAREADNRALHAKVEEVEHSLSILQSQLAEETAIRIEASTDRDRVLRDDTSAASVVERYMTFTQKTHATIHMHLENLRTRSAATQASLRKEALGLQRRLDGEIDRNRKVREAMEELSEGLAREAAGRRREVGVRLVMIKEEERRARRVEKWLDKVRRSRADSAQAAVADATVLAEMLDEGVRAVLPESAASAATQPEAGSSKWKLFGRRRDRATTISQLAQIPEGHNEEDSLMRVLLAEELVNTLVQDLQIETERRLELEKQRVEWLAREAAQGVPAEEPVEDGEERDGRNDLMFDANDHDLAAPDGGDDDEATPQDALLGSRLDADVETIDLAGGAAAAKSSGSPAKLDVPLPSPEISPFVEQLRDIFQPLEARSLPMQKTLHDLSHSLAALRASVPPAGGSATSNNLAPPISPTSAVPGAARKRHIFSLSRPPLEDPVLVALLDGLHEVIEDARVDLEISLADEERVYRGFEALLDVGTVSSGTDRGAASAAPSTKTSGAVKPQETLGDAREYITDRLDWQGWKRLERRVDEAMGDLGVLKAKVQELELGGEGLTPPAVEGVHGILDGPGGDAPNIPTTSMSTSTLDPRSAGGAFRKFAPFGPSAPSVWETLDLRTVSPAQARIPSPLHTPGSGIVSPSGGFPGLSIPGQLNPFGSLSQLSLNQDGTASPNGTSSDGRSVSHGPGALGVIGNMGRSFSAGVVGAPRKVSTGLAGLSGGLAGIYRPRRGTLGKKDKAHIVSDEEDSSERSSQVDASVRDTSVVGPGMNGGHAINGTKEHKETKQEKDRNVDEEVKALLGDSDVE